MFHLQHILPYETFSFQSKPSTWFNAILLQWNDMYDKNRHGYQPMVFLLTSVAVSVIQFCAVVISAVGRDRADSGLASSTVWTRPGHRVADAAIRQPAWCAAVQASLPGQIKLSHCGQLSPKGHTAVWSWRQRQSAWDWGMKHFTWRRRNRPDWGSSASRWCGFLVVRFLYQSDI